VIVFDAAMGQTDLVFELDILFADALTVSWSPDGTRLLLGQAQEAGGDRIGILTIATKRLVWLATPNASEAHWSPDGESIVFSQWSRQSSAVSVAHTTGTIKRVLVRGGGWAGPARSTSSGSYSPDGSRVAYCYGEAIWSIRVDGKDKRKLIAFGEQPAWSSR
jgi:Tol biopolymer transport system component